jgi:hypothetical protein
MSSLSPFIDLLHLLIYCDPIYSHLFIFTLYFLICAIKKPPEGGFFTLSNEVVYCLILPHLFFMGNRQYQVSYRVLHYKLSQN